MAKTSIEKQKALVQAVTQEVLYADMEVFITILFPGAHKDDKRNVFSLVRTAGGDLLILGPEGRLDELIGPLAQP